jgi:DnaJ family protein C protein 8
MNTENLEIGHEVVRVLRAFKLNPYEKLDLRFDSCLDEVKKQFRKLSILIHPDKSKHPKADQAFKIIRDAHDEILDDERREKLHYVLRIAMENVHKDRDKEIMKDMTLKAANLLEMVNLEEVKAEWQKSDEFYSRWTTKSRELLARSEFRNRKLKERIQEEEKRMHELSKKKKNRFFE